MSKQMSISEVNALIKGITPDGPLYVVNNTDHMEMGAGDLNFSVVVDGESFPIKIKKTWLPQDLSLQAPSVEKIKGSHIFRRYATSNLIIIMMPEDAERILAGREAQAESARIAQLKKVMDEDDGSVQVRTNKRPTTRDGGKGNDNSASSEDNIGLTIINDMKGHRISEEAACRRLLINAGEITLSQALEISNINLPSQVSKVVSSIVADKQEEAAGTAPASILNIPKKAAPVATKGGVPTPSRPSAPYRSGSSAAASAKMPAHEAKYRSGSSKEAASKASRSPPYKSKG